MSIEKTFDSKSAEILKAGEIFKRKEGFPKVVIGTFSQKNLDVILDGRRYQSVAKLDFGQEGALVYKVFDDEIGQFGLFYCHLGGAAVAAQLEEVIAMGGEKFIIYGSCGCLVQGIEAGSIVVPTAAYRDEGTSYHYMEPSDFVHIEDNEKCVKIIESLGVKPLITKVWTTDALYRETEENLRKRKELGCKVVDMECASMAAVTKFRDVSFMQFLYIEDNLDGEQWDPGLLGKFTKTHRQQYAMVALEIAKELV